MRVLMREARLPFPADLVFSWHLRPGALERLLPPWRGVRVIARRGVIEQGGEVELMVPIWPGERRWIARHEGFIPGRAFADVQVDGPFRSWRHTHRIIPDGNGCLLEDQIEFEPPLGPLGLLVTGGLIERRVEEMLAFRYRRLADDLGRHLAFAGRPSLRVAISGAGGVLGREVSAYLSGAGHTLVPLTRSGGAGIAWDPGRSVDIDALGACDALIHLAGRGIADRRWTPALKSEIWSSRVDATRHLCEALARSPRKPGVLLCASAVGIYGNRGDEHLKEDSRPGEGFLADLCRAWEEACIPAREAGIRVVHLRLGVVLSAAGGVLSKLTPPTRWGVAGPVGGGDQWMPWIGSDDVVGAIQHLLHADGVSGAVNLVSPEPATNRQVIRALGRTLHRPTLLPVPGFAIRWLLGEMGQETVLASQRVLPARLLGAGFPFLHRDLGRCLASELGR